jgi:hypothetical protein
MLENQDFLGKILIYIIKYYLQYLDNNQHFVKMWFTKSGQTTNFIMCFLYSKSKDVWNQDCSYTTFILEIQLHIHYIPNIGLNKTYYMDIML